MGQFTMLVKAETLCEILKDRMLQRKLGMQCSFPLHLWLSPPAELQHREAAGALLNMLDVLC